MFDERQFIARIEASDAESFGDYLRRPTAQEERALRAYFGEQRYERLHSLALRKRSLRGAAGRGTVIVIHGIMGAELTAFDSEGEECPVWVNLWRIMRGQLSRLRLADDGLAPFDPDWEARATGMMKKHYGELILSLSRRWRVWPFWFDWRKDLNIAAAKLHAEIESFLGEDDPAHIVAHSMGGLVARTFIQRFPRRWKAMAGKSGGTSGGRLIMLGTPNHGSFAVPQIITGLEKKVRQIAMIDAPHNRSEVLEIVNSFPGSYQMLPSPLVMPSMDPLYTAQTYQGFTVLQSHLDNARQHHQLLAGVVDPERMIYVAGDLQPTLSNIKNFARIADRKGYVSTMAGDGRVPHNLGLLPGVDTYYVVEGHGSLPSNSSILGALNDLLTVGSCDSLAREPHRVRGGLTRSMSQLVAAQEQAENEQIEAFLRRTSSRGPLEELESRPISDEERRVEDLLLRGFVETSNAGGELSRVVTPRRKRVIRISLRCGDICAPDEAQPPQGAAKARRADAVSVGHYIGILPQGAEMALDRAISDAPSNSASDDLLITQLSLRGTIRGELGEPFIIPDPRSGSRKRVIVAMGMGLPGRFGAPELTVMVRELCWALGRLGKRHLATVLIGGGHGNLEVEVAVEAWFEGIHQALHTGGGTALERVTFVEWYEDRIRGIHQAIEKAKEVFSSRLEVRYEPWSDGELRSLEKIAADRQYERRMRDLAERKRRFGDGAGMKSKSQPPDPAPTRITVNLEGETYRFGALTADASIPERVVPLDPKLVEDANRELVAASAEVSQREHGRFLERLLIPRDLRLALQTSAPLVLMLDATTARIHWEMVAQPPAVDIDQGSDQGDSDGAAKGGTFLGISRGLTRQLRTAFAPPPEPPPLARRRLRVLVVADPAEDDHLPGAEEEGVEVVDLFEAFNEVYAGTSDNHVEVTRLFGPRSATRTNVLRHLMLRRYDVVHFAGHCIYDEKDPAKSGWVFSGGTRLTANELDRVDRIPRFVFSNACESGITPDRSENRSASLAPSFAEAFFARGVSNFVCTAWPVDDLFARIFARELYSGLLGLQCVDEEAGLYKARDPLPMHRAMRDARRRVASVKSGLRTWGAYQHYGSPFYRFFHPDSMGKPAGTPAEKMAEENVQVKSNPKLKAKRRATAKAGSKARTVATGKTKGKG